MSDELIEFIDRWNNQNPTMLVQTSGSTGKPKEMHVSKAMMIESAKMTINALGLNKDTIALLNLPIKYISGQMMVIRSIIGNYKLVEGLVTGHPLKDFDIMHGNNKPITFAAMTPMQVYNTSLVPQEWNSLAKINTLIIGGGAISNELEKKLQTIPIKIYATYGMTETLSHIALRPVNGPYKSNYFTPFKGIDIKTDFEGKLHIDAPKICTKHLITNDIVEIIKTNKNISNTSSNEISSIDRSTISNTKRNVSLKFKFIGRLDNVVNSGGVKIHIEEVENKIIEYYRNNKKRLKEFDFAISYIPDTTYGEMLVLLDTTSSLSIDQFDFLDSIKRPKKVIQINEIPLTSTNKINRRACHQYASEKSILLKKGGL